MIKKQVVVNLNNSSNKRYPSIVLSDSEVTFLKIQIFVHSYIVFCLHNLRSML